jgi:inorganic pyrophosphatase
MDLKHLPTGKNPPHDVNVVIEIAQGAQPVKYELDKDSGALMLDRFLSTSMVYPCNYGFIPHTLSGDGDPCDALVLAPFAIANGAVVRARPIGALLMEDESGVDEKILMVPVSKLTPLYNDVQSYTDVPAITLQQIEHFFAHYKDLEKGKWVKILNWVDAAAAADLITQGMARHKQG